MEANLQNLPEQINHPAHSQPNQLVLSPFNGRVGDPYYGLLVLLRATYCRVCLHDFEEGQYIYACRTESHRAGPCYFSVCIRCSSIKARLVYFVHGHPMFFLERRHPDYPLECFDCGTGSHELMFACVAANCIYNLHLRCGPLPTAIPFQYAGYDMTLTLTDALNEGVDAEDSWCDICEERRDPTHPVYHSSDPLFTATVECVLPQIVKALQGHLGEVRLRRCASHVAGVVLVSTRNSTDDDAKQVIADHRTNTQAAEAATDGYVTLFSGEQLLDLVTVEDGEYFSSILDKADDEPGDPTYFKFSDKAFERFREHVAFSGEVNYAYIATQLSEHPVYTKVGGNFVAPELVPLYRKLIDRHGDFTANSPVSPAARASFLLRMLTIIKVMLAKRIFSLSGNELCLWQHYFFKSARDELGFEVQFALDYLERAARCWYALGYIKVRDEIAADLSGQIERLAKDIDEDRPKLEELKAHHKTAMEGSAFGQQQCLYKTSKLQWKSAGEFLGLDPDEDS